MRIRRHAELAEELLPWRTAISDQTRFQEDFGEDLASGEVLDQNQLNYIDYFRRWHDMGLNEKGLYKQRHPVTEWATFPEGPNGPKVMSTGSVVRQAIPEHIDRKWKNDAMQAVEDSGWQGLTLHDRPGDAPQHGYMVSIPGHEEHHPMDELSGETLGDYGDRKRDIINEDGNYQGGWAESRDWYNDVSRNYNDLWHADKAAFQGDQLALYDIDRDRSFDTDEAGWMTGAPWIVGGKDL